MRELMLGLADYFAFYNGELRDRFIQCCPASKLP